MTIIVLPDNDVIAKRKAIAPDPLVNGNSQATNTLNLAIHLQLARRTRHD